MTVVPEAVRLIENAEVVLPDRVMRGWVAVEDGRVAALGEGQAPGRGLDLRGDHLIPGLVELHTDHLESHYAPRPGVRWHPLGAVLAYDAQIAASGITTVFDSLRAGADIDGGGLADDLLILAEAIDEARRGGLLRVEHLTHLRCELPAPDVAATASAFCARFPVGLISLMNHTPGQRQFLNLANYLTYARRSGKSAEEVRALAERRMAEGGPRAAESRPALAALARRRSIPLASHDDTTSEDVAQSVAEGALLAEFPTTAEAARSCRAYGLAVVMGAPNLIRGCSHSGNVAAEELAREGLLSILSSDYVPGSLLMAAFSLPQRVPGITLAQAVATVTANPAHAVGLCDRGEIAPSQRADLVRVQIVGRMPVVRQVWCEGVEVA